MDNRIYLDYAATTPVRREVLEAMLPYFSQAGHNPSSLHAEGRRARAGLDDARDRVAQILGVPRKTITFTGSGSESDNQAIVSVARALRDRGRHIISSVIEHHAVLHALDALHDEGFDVTLLPVDARGLVDVEEFSAAIRSDTVLASIMLANNEIGTIQPVARLAGIARARNVLFHTDAVQAAPWMDVRPDALGVDMLAISAHKFYGPKGVGVLYAREGIPIQPLVYGGGQEFGRRSGTENVAGIVGLATALGLAVQERAETAPRVEALRDRLEARIKGLEDVRINGEGAPRLPNNCNVSFAGIDSESMLVGLDLQGVAVSAGSACTSGALEPSHVITALDIDPRWHQGVIRFSLGTGTMDAEIERAGSLVANLASEMRERNLHS